MPHRYGFALSAGLATVLSIGCGQAAPPTEHQDDEVTEAPVTCTSSQQCDDADRCFEGRCVASLCDDTTPCSEGGACLDGACCYPDEVCSPCDSEDCG